MHLLKLLGTLYKVKENRLENLYTTKEENTKISFSRINNINLNDLKTSGFYLSASWDNNIIGLPSPIVSIGLRAFYLQVFSLNESNSYCQQILYSFNGNIYYRSITTSNGNFSNWVKIA